MPTPKYKSDMDESKGKDYAISMPQSKSRGPGRSRGLSISINKVAIPVSQITHNPAVSIIAYCLASISMTITNKYCVSGPHWNMNFFLLAFQSTICILTIKIWFPISLLLVGMTYTGANSLQYLSVPVYTIFKNLTIIVIAYGEVFLFGARVTSATLASFGLIILSSVVAAWADISHAAHLTYDRGLIIGMEDERLKVDAGRVHLLNIGYAWMALNVVCSAAYLLGIRKVIKSMNFRDWDTMYYNNLLTLPILILSTLFLESWSLSNLALNFPSSSRNSQLLAMIYSGLATMFISYASAWCIRITSSTTYSMVGALNKLPIAITGLLFFREEVTKGGVLAIGMGFGSGVVYAFAKRKERGYDKRDEDMEGESEGLLLPLRRASSGGKKAKL